MSKLSVLYHPSCKECIEYIEMRTQSDNYYVSFHLDDGFAEIIATAQSCDECTHQTVDIEAGDLAVVLRDVLFKEMRDGGDIN